MNKKNKVALVLALTVQCANAYNPELDLFTEIAEEAVVLAPLYATATPPKMARKEQSKPAVDPFAKYGLAPALPVFDKEEVIEQKKLPSLVSSLAASPVCSDTDD